MRIVPVGLLILSLALVTPVRSRTIGGTACVLGDHGGISAPEARSAAALVCDEIARRGGASAGLLADPEGAEALYCVDILPLGRTVILRLSYEAPVGVIQGRRSFTLSGLEEVPQAAPRLAEALLSGRSVEETATVDGLVHEETRRYEKKPGEVLWGFAVIATHVPGLDVPLGPGGALSLYYETPDFAVGSEMRLSGGPGRDDYVVFFSWGVGARYFFLDGNWSPYVGGGLAFDTIAWGDKDLEDDNGSAFGVGAYVDVGVELLRLHSTRFTIQIRADLPFFDADNDWWGGGGRKAAYLAPISLGVGVAW